MTENVELEREKTTKENRQFEEPTDEDIHNVQHT